MWSSPEGYGSISSTYVEGVSSAADGSGFGTVKVSSAAQTACQRFSTAVGSYRSCSARSIALDSLPDTKKPLGREAQRESARHPPRFLPGLREKLLHVSNANRHDRRVLTLFPDSGTLDGARLTLGGLTADALAEEYGTPLVVLCEDTIRATARALRDAVGDGRVFFGTKALPNVALLRVLREEGVGADVASAGELAFAAAAGLDGDELVVHGNNKDAAFLAAAARVAAPVVLDARDEAR